VTSPFANALILTGPTGSGKSALALELAPLLNAEIVAADSMTLYRGMDIGTAKPTPDECARVPHHLIDVLDPWESASVAWWLDRATAAAADIEARGKVALLVGGTPFYLKAVLCGLFESPRVDPELRARLEAEAAANGATALHAKLAQIDPASAGRLHPNDTRRVVRALEVWHQTGKPLSEWQRQSWWDGDKPRFRPGACLYQALPRDELYARIDQRVTTMFASGWINEVLRLRESVYPLSREARMALGYREIGEYLDGQRTLPETVAEVQLRTRQYAKRQLTWFRGLPGCEPADRKLTIERWVRTMPASSSGP
jgi:tRNA dimethylallyltransferase